MVGMVSVIMYASDAQRFQFNQSAPEPCKQDAKLHLHRAHAPQKPATTQIDRLKPRSRLTEAKCRSAHSVRLARLLHTAAAAAEMLPKLKWCGRGRSSHAAWLCRCNPKLDTTQVNMWLYRLGCPHGATNLRTCTSASSCWTPRPVL